MNTNIKKQQIIVSSEGNGLKWGKKVIDFIIKKAFPETTVIYEMSLDCDVIVLSHFINEEALWNKQYKKYIYWSGESYDVFTHSKASSSISLLTTLKEDKEDKEETDNQMIDSTKKVLLYIPYTLYSPYLYKPRKYSNDINERAYLLAYCSSNPTKIREELYNTFVDKVGEEADLCHALGKCHGKYKKTQKQIDGHWEDESLVDTYKDYKFVFALENKQMNGYVTEKLLNAFYSGAIPIYWGSSNVNDLFNKKAFINVSDYENVEECVDFIINMTPEELEKMQKEPIYNETNEIIHLMDEEFNAKNGNKTLDEYVNVVREFLLA